MRTQFPLPHGHQHTVPHTQPLIPVHDCPPHLPRPLAVKPLPWPWPLPPYPAPPPPPPAADAARRVKRALHIPQPYRHPLPAQPVRKSPQNALLGHQQRGRTPPKDLGYRAHVVHDKVHVPARSTPSHVKSTHPNIQFSRLLGINPWGASADCRALGAPYPHKKPTWRDGAVRCVSVYRDRWTLGHLRLPPPADCARVVDCALWIGRIVHAWCGAEKVSATRSTAMNC